VTGAKSALIYVQSGSAKQGYATVLSLLPSGNGVAKVLRKAVEEYLRNHK